MKGINFRVQQQRVYEEMKLEFECMQETGHHYTDGQKDFAFRLIDDLGVRATARVLKLPRKTLQRWCRKHNVYVRRCPAWVYEWAEKRNRRRMFWQMRGFDYEITAF